MIRVLLVDDQPMVRAGLGLVLRSQPDIQVVGERDNGDDIVAAVTEVAPDVVCMDVRMPGTDGVTATRRLHAAAGPPVCILTTFGDEDVLWSAVDAGAPGFELKSATAEKPHRGGTDHRGRRHVDRRDTAGTDPPVVPSTGPASETRPTRDADRAGDRRAAPDGPRRVEP